MVSSIYVNNDTIKALRFIFCLKSNRIYILSTICYVVPDEYCLYATVLFLFLNKNNNNCRWRRLYSRQTHERHRLDRSGAGHGRPGGVEPGVHEDRPFAGGPGRVAGGRPPVFVFRSRNRRPRGVRPGRATVGGDGTGAGRRRLDGRLGGVRVAVLNADIGQASPNPRRRRRLGRDVGSLRRVRGQTVPAGLLPSPVRRRHPNGL